MAIFTFTATVASRGYHIHQNTSWTNAKQGEKVTVELEMKILLEIDRYACPIKIKNMFSDNLILRHVLFIIKTEGGKIFLSF